MSRLYIPSILGPRDTDENKTHVACTYIKLILQGREVAIIERMSIVCNKSGVIWAKGKSKSEEKGTCAKDGGEMRCFK